MTSNSPENPYGQPAPQAPYAQPAPYGQQPVGYAGAPAVADPGKTMSIIAIILPFVGLGLVGLILGIIAKSKSKKAGYKNTLALVAIIISILAVIGTIVSVIAIIALAAPALDQVQQVVEACKSGAQTVTVNGQIFSCAGVK
jgi:hypothetical protein